MKQCLISLIFFLLLQTLITSTTSYPDIIQNTCKKCASNDPNINYTLCMDSFNSISKSHHANLKGLGVIATQITKANATNTTIIIKTILKWKAQMSPYMKSCMDTCLELYDDAIDSLRNSVKAIQIGHYEDANVMLSSVINAPGTCEDGFRVGKIESPLTKENHDFFGQSVIALCITAQLQGLGVVEYLN